MSKETLIKEIVELEELIKNPENSPVPITLAEMLVHEKRKELLSI
jgi:hypothetical protein